MILCTQATVSYGFDISDLTADSDSQLENGRGIAPSTTTWKAIGFPFLTLFQP